MCRELFRRLPDIRATGEPDRLRSSFINGIKHLPCRFSLPLSRRAAGSEAGRTVRGRPLPSTSQRRRGGRPEAPGPGGGAAAQGLATITTVAVTSTANSTAEAAITRRHSFLRSGADPGSPTATWSLRSPGHSTSSPLKAATAHNASPMEIQPSEKDQAPPDMAISTTPSTGTRNRMRPAQFTPPVVAAHGLGTRARAHEGQGVAAGHEAPSRSRSARCRTWASSTMSYPALRTRVAAAGQSGATMVIPGILASSASPRPSVPCHVQRPRNCYGGVTTLPPQIPTNARIHVPEEWRAPVGTGTGQDRALARTRNSWIRNSWIRNNGIEVATTVRTDISRSPRSVV